MRYIILFIIFFAASLYGETLKITKSGTGVSLTLNEALKRSSPGDTLLISDDGEYEIDLASIKERILVRGQGANPVTRFLSTYTNDADAGDCQISSVMMYPLSYARTNASNADCSSQHLNIQYEDLTGYYTVSRSFIPFDVSSLPTGTVNSASIRLYCDNSSPDDDEIVVVAHSGTETNSFSTSNYTEYGSTIFASKSFNDLSQSTYVTFSLNNSSHSVITDAYQYAVFCLMTQRDLTGNNPTSEGGGYVSFYSADFGSKKKSLMPMPTTPAECPKLIIDMTINQAPSAPSNPSPEDGAEGSPTSVTFTWDASDPDEDALRYDLYLDTQSDLSDMLPTASDLTTKSYTHSGLDEGSQYYWKVIAYDGSNYTEGPTWSFKTNAAPTLNYLSPEDEAVVLSSSVELSWEGNDEDEDALYYDLYVGTSNPPPLFEEETEATAKTVLSLEESATYYWRVKAHDGTATTEGPVYSFSTVRYKTPSTPLTPQGGALIAITDDYSYYTESDDPNGDVVWFQFDWGDGSQSQWTQGQSVPTGNRHIINLSHSYTQPGTYKIKARAKDRFSNTSPWSGELTVNAHQWVPRQPVPGHEETDVSCFPVLSWESGNAKRGAPLYDVYFGESESQINLVAEDIASTEHPTAELDETTDYYWRVVTQLDGQSYPGPVWKFTTGENEPPTAPHSPFPENNADGTAIVCTLTWNREDSDNDPLYCKLYFDTVNPPEEIAAESLPVSEFVLPPLDYDSTYFWKIEVSDGKETVNGPVWSFTTIQNFPPAVPEIQTELSEGYIDSLYEFIFSTNDTEQEEVKFIIDWGDGQAPRELEMGPEYEKTLSFSWPDSGVYLVKAAARDSYGNLSEWSDPVSVRIFYKKKITILAPEPGTEWRAGTERDIKLRLENIDPPLRIFFSSDNGRNYKIIKQYAHFKKKALSGSGTDTLTYPWTIPDSIQSEECLIRARAYPDSVYEDTTDGVFTILEKPQLTITEPAENYYLNQGETVTIQWTNDSFTNEVNLKYKEEGVYRWSLIEKNIENNNEYQWLVPDTMEGSFRIKVENAADTALDDSTGVLSVGPPAWVEITYPSENDDIYSETLDSILFNYNLFHDDFTINAFSDNGYDPVILSESHDLAETFSYRVPFPDGKMTLQALSNVHPNIKGETPRIEINPDPLKFNFLSPKAGDTVFTQDTVDIKWETVSGWADSVTIKFSSDNGSTYEKIADSLPNIGVFSWTTPPDTKFPLCYLKIASLFNETLQDSVGPFNLLGRPLTTPETDTLIWEKLTINTCSTKTVALINNKSVADTVFSHTPLSPPFELVSPGTLPWVIQPKSRKELNIKFCPSQTGPAEQVLYFTLAEHTPAITLMGNCVKPDFYFVKKIITSFVTDQSAVITWETNIPVFAELVLYKDNQKEKEIKVNTILANDFIYTLTELESGTEYHYEVVLTLENGYEIFRGGPDEYSFTTLDYFTEKEVALTNKPQVTYLSSGRAIIRFVTDLPLHSQLTLYDSQKNVIQTFSGTKPELEHIFQLQGLNLNTKYFYTIKKANGSSLSPRDEIYYTFTTLAEADQTPPVLISGPLIITSNNTAFFKADFNEACRLHISYYPSGDPGLVSAISSSAYRKHHLMVLRDLNPSTTYYFSYSAEDPEGNSDQYTKKRSVLSYLKNHLSYNPPNQFSTGENSDATPPIFTSLPAVSLIYDSTALLEWKSDEPAVFYLEVYDDNNQLVFSKQSNDFTNMGQFFIPRLLPGLSYSITLTLEDMMENMGDPQHLSFTTKLNRNESHEYEIVQSITPISTPDFVLLYWKTNLPCDSRSIVSQQVSMDQGRNFLSSDLERTHILLLDGFTQDIDYFYNKSGYDFYEKQVYFSPVDSFKYSPQSGQRPIEFTSPCQWVYEGNQAKTMSFTTNHHSHCVLEYYPVDESENSVTISDNELATNHTITLYSLNNNQEYVSRLTCTDLFSQSVDTQFTFTAGSGNDLTPPPSPKAISAGIDSTNRVTVQWETVSSPDFAGYTVYRYTETDSRLVTLSTGLTINRFIDEFHGEEGRFFYGVASYDIWGNISDTVFTVDGVTIINETSMNQLDDFHLYPNPAYDYIILKGSMKSPQKIHVEIFNLLGVSVFKENLSGTNTLIEKRINVKRWPAGFYFLRINIGANTSKIIKFLVIK